MQRKYPLVAMLHPPPPVKQLFTHRLFDSVAKISYDHHRDDYVCEIDPIAVLAFLENEGYPPSDILAVFRSKPRLYAGKSGMTYYLISLAVTLTNGMGRIFYRTD